MKKELIFNRLKDKDLQHAAISKGYYDEVIEIKKPHLLQQTGLVILSIQRLFGFLAACTCSISSASVAAASAVISD